MIMMLMKVSDTIRLLPYQIYWKKKVFEW